MAWTALVLDGIVFPICVLYLISCYFAAVRVMRGEDTLLTDGSLLSSRHVRLRQRLVTVALVTGIAWMLGALADIWVWGYSLKMQRAPPQVRLYGFLSSVFFPPSLPPSLPPS